VTYLPAQEDHLENVNRGTLVALLVIPIGIIAWVVIWSIGFIASIVSLGVAYLAMFLYKLGSGGKFGRTGAVRVTIITLVTIALAIFAGIVTDVARGLVAGTGNSPFDAFTAPDFWNLFGMVLAYPDVQAELLPSVLISIAFGILGCFGILRSAFRNTAPAVVSSSAQPSSSSTQPTDDENSPTPPPPPAPTP
jgi:hypothetical protein